jgi:hypothetical protein
VVQALPSLQAVPFETGVVVHPNAGLQLSFVQTLLSLQTTAVPPQVPFVHWSLVVHRLPSLQGDPFVTGVAEQPVAGLQLSVVQALLSLQTRPVPAHVPD